MKDTKLDAQAGQDTGTRPGSLAEYRARMESAIAQQLEIFEKADPGGKRQQLLRRLEVHFPGMDHEQLIRETALTAFARLTMEEKEATFDTPTEERDVLLAGRALIPAIIRAQGARATRKFCEDMPVIDMDELLEEAPAPEDVERWKGIVPPTMDPTVSAEHAARWSAVSPIDREEISRLWVEFAAKAPQQRQAEVQELVRDTPTEFTAAEYCAREFIDAESGYFNPLKAFAHRAYVQLTREQVEALPPEGRHEFMAAMELIPKYVKRERARAEREMHQHEDPEIEGLPPQERLAAIYERQKERDERMRSGEAESIVFGGDGSGSFSRRIRREQESSRDSGGVIF